MFAMFFYNVCCFINFICIFVLFVKKAKACISLFFTTRLKKICRQVKKTKGCCIKKRIWQIICGEKREAENKQKKLNQHQIIMLCHILSITQNQNKIYNKRKSKE